MLILFPGLTGGSGDSYVQHAVLQARHAGVRAAVFNSRGTADSPVLTPQFYSASFTDDTREVGAAHLDKSTTDCMNLISGNMSRALHGIRMPAAARPTHSLVPNKKTEGLGD